MNVDPGSQIVDVLICSVYDFKVLINLFSFVLEIICPFRVAVEKEVTRIGGDK